MKKEFTLLSRLRIVMVGLWMVFMGMLPPVLAQTATDNIGRARRANRSLAAGTNRSTGQRLNVNNQGSEFSRSNARPHFASLSGGSDVRAQSQARRPRSRPDSLTSNARASQRISRQALQSARASRSSSRQAMRASRSAVQSSRQALQSARRSAKNMRSASGAARRSSSTNRSDLTSARHSARNSRSRMGSAQKPSQASRDALGPARRSSSAGDRR